MAESYLMPGTLDVLILRTLAWEPMHGYQISRWIGDRTAAALVVQDAALYKGLRRLEASGAIAAEWGMTEDRRRARYYRLTGAGRRRLSREVAAWRDYAAAIASVIEPFPARGAT